jgi:diguanylate cyclase (GGDEF)-like protein
MGDNTLNLSTTAVSLAVRMKETTASIPCLVVMRGLDVGRVIPLQESTMVAGREETCEIQLTDEGISRRHAQFTKLAGGFGIEDLGSTNGVFVNGEPVTSQLLAEGDKVLLGQSTVLKFTHQDELELEFQRNIHQSASVDGLTGALNRKALDQRLESEWSFAHRHGTNLGVIMADVDHFKQVNDTYGHSVGDEVLKAIAKVLGDTIRKEDVFGRYGGEEFLLIIRDVGDRGTTRLANRLRRLVERLQFQCGSETITVTISLGVATMEETAVTAKESLVRVADQRLYAAKRAGRNRVVSEDV